MNSAPKEYAHMVILWLIEGGRKDKICAYVDEWFHGHQHSPTGSDHIPMSNDTPPLDVYFMYDFVWVGQG